MLLIFIRLLGCVSCIFLIVRTHISNDHQTAPPRPLLPSSCCSSAVLCRATSPCSSIARSSSFCRASQQFIKETSQQMNSTGDLTSLNSKLALFLSFQIVQHSVGSQQFASFYSKVENEESNKSTGRSGQAYLQHQQFYSQCSTHTQQQNSERMIMLSFVAMALCHISHNQNLTFSGILAFQRCLNDLSDMHQKDDYASS